MLDSTKDKMLDHTIRAMRLLYENGDLSRSDIVGNFSYMRLFRILLEEVKLEKTKISELKEHLREGYNGAYK